jgi:hypothetical protein
MIGVPSTRPTLRPTATAAVESTYLLQSLIISYIFLFVFALLSSLAIKFLRAEVDYEIQDRDLVEITSVTIFGRNMASMMQVATLVILTMQFRTEAHYTISVFAALTLLFTPYVGVYLVYLCFFSFDSKDLLEREMVFPTQLTYSRSLMSLTILLLVVNCSAVMCFPFEMKWSYKGVGEYPNAWVMSICCASNILFSTLTVGYAIASFAVAADNSDDAPLHIVKIITLVAAIIVLLYRIFTCAMVYYFGNKPFFDVLHTILSQLWYASRQVVVTDREVEMYDKYTSDYFSHNSENEQNAAVLRQELTSYANECYDIMRAFVPPNISTVTVGVLTEKHGYSSALAMRLKSCRCLWLLRMSKESIQKMHYLRLIDEYNIRSQRLDIVEIAALFAATPAVFTFDSPGREKAKWRGFLEASLKDKYQKMRLHRLTGEQARHSAYRGQMAMFHNSGHRSLEQNIVISPIAQRAPLGDVLIFICYFKFDLGPLL